MIHIIDKRHVSRICKELHTTVKILNKKNFQTWYQTNRYFRKNEMLNRHYSSEKCSLNGIQEYITNSSAEWLNLKKNWQYQMVVRIWSKLNSYITDGNILWKSHFGKLFANLKPNHIYVLWPRIPTPKYIFKRNECKDSPQDILKDIHSSFIHSNSKLETT